MNRRDLLLLLGSAMTAAGALRAQQKAMPVVGYLGLGSPPANLGKPLRGQLHKGMSEMGFVEGQNMMWEYRWADFHHDRLPALAADLVSRKVDVIVTQGGLPSARAAKNATSTIPIVFTAVGDPVGSALVASLAHPGGNLTGFSNLTIELAPKRLELLSELVPQADVIAALAVSDTEPEIRNLQEAARTKGLQLHPLKAGTEDEIETAFASLVQLQAGALLVSSDAIFIRQRDQVVALASRYAVRRCIGGVSSLRRAA
jgi:putative ABC transport system substrate-binding protein